MEAIRLNINTFGETDETFVELKVRGKEDDYNYYVFPKYVIEKVIICLKKSNIYCDEIPADSSILQNLPLAESKYSVEDYDEFDCMAVHSVVDICELYEVIEYIDQHIDEQITITIYKNSELPEFQELLSAKAKHVNSVEVQALMSSYMKLLLDMSVGDLGRTIIDFMDTASFGKMLNMYSNSVSDYIFSHVTNRLETQLREEMLD